MARSNRVCRKVASSRLLHFANRERFTHAIRDVAHFDFKVVIEHPPLGSRNIVRIVAERIARPL